MISSWNGTAMIFDVRWKTTEELIAYAKECCVVRELTPDERELFGLPPVGDADSGTAPPPDESSDSGVGAPVALVALLPVAALGVWYRRKNAA